MAYAYSWPPSLPSYPQKGYTEDKGFNLIKTPMDAGPAKIRKRSRRPDMLNVSYIMTSAEVVILQDFVENVLLGTARFGITHPRTNATGTEVRLVPQGEGVLYNMTYLAPGYYTVTLQLEVLP